MIESRISYAWLFWPLRPCRSVTMPASLLRSAAKSPQNRRSVQYAFNLTSYLLIFNDRSFGIIAQLEWLVRFTPKSPLTLFSLPNDYFSSMLKFQTGTQNRKKFHFTH